MALVSGLVSVAVDCRVGGPAGAGGGVGISGAGPEATPGIVPGGSVIAASSGFSISMVPPHFAHLVRARGRSPSLPSSNLYFAWQLGQTMIMSGPIIQPAARATWRRGPPARMKGEGRLSRPGLQDGATNKEER